MDAMADKKLGDSYNRNDLHINLCIKFFKTVGD